MQRWRRRAAQGRGEAAARGAEDRRRHLPLRQVAADRPSCGRGRAEAPGHGREDRQHQQLQPADRPEQGQPDHRGAGETRTRCGAGGVGRLGDGRRTDHQLRAQPSPGGRPERPRAV